MHPGLEEILKMVIADFPYQPSETMNPRDVPSDEERFQKA